MPYRDICGLRHIAWPTSSHMTGLHASPVMSSPVTTESAQPGLAQRILIDVFPSIDGSSCSSVQTEAEPLSFGLLFQVKFWKFSKVDTPANSWLNLWLNHGCRLDQFDCTHATLSTLAAALGYVPRASTDRIPR